MQGSYTDAVWWLHVLFVGHQIILSKSKLTDASGVRRQIRFTSHDPVDVMLLVQTWQSSALTASFNIYTFLVFTGPLLCSCLSCNYSDNLSLLVCFILTSKLSYWVIKYLSTNLLVDIGQLLLSRRSPLKDGQTKADEMAKQRHWYPLGGRIALFCCDV